MSNQQQRETTTAVDPPSLPSTKRRREDDQPSVTPAEVQPTKRRAVLEQDILFRILLPSKQIGKVIGKGGHRIQKIREDSKANIKIADPIAWRSYVVAKGGHGNPTISIKLEISSTTSMYLLSFKRHEERVIIISSKDSESTFTDAENALHQIGSLVLMMYIREILMEIAD